MKCLICEIVKGDEKSFKIFEDDDFIAFLDIRPLFPGHCLMAPKQHVENIYSLSPDKGNNFLSAIQTIGNAITRGMASEGTFIAINNNVSQSIPHLHIHIVPRNKGDGLKGFFWPRNKYESLDQIRETQEKIKKFVKSNSHPSVN